MSTTTINTPHPAPDFRISIFNHPLYRSTAQGFRMPFTAAGLYIKQSLSWDDKDHRSVTQSLAISPPLTRRLYRRSDPGTVCCRHLNFDRFHRTCLQDVGIVVRSKQWGGKPKTDPTPHILAVGCHPRSTICHTPLIECRLQAALIQRRLQAALN